MLIFTQKKVLRKALFLFYRLQPVLTYLSTEGVVELAVL